jgi:hypothetical protein
VSRHIQEERHAQEGRLVHPLRQTREDLLPLVDREAGEHFFFHGPEKLTNDQACVPLGRSRRLGVGPDQVYPVRFLLLLLARPNDRPCK